MASRLLQTLRSILTRPPLLLGGVLGACLIWASWPALIAMAARWSSDPRYSHGFLVPMFSLYLLWHRKERLIGVDWRSNAWGLVFILVGAILKLGGSYVYVEWVDAVSLLPWIAGLVVLTGGWPALRWSWPSIAFLVFMVPLPYRVELALGASLQRIATLASTYALQTIGMPAVSEGNIILINDSRIGVVDACNGLGMLVMFCAFGVAVSLIVERRLMDRVLVLLSVVPIALAANIARITVTGFLHETVGGKVADAVYHDLAGWLMMPLALAALWIMLFLLSRVFVERTPPQRTASDLIYDQIVGLDAGYGRGGRSR